jgi:hypothetical protein
MTCMYIRDVNRNLMALTSNRFKYVHSRFDVHSAHAILTQYDV